VGEIITF